MKNIILLILNGLPMAFLILFYGMRADTELYVYMAWFLLCAVNTLFVHKRWHLFGMNLYLALTSSIGLYANSLFYYSFVYYDASANEAAWRHDITYMLIFISILTVLGIGARCALIYINKKRRALKDKKYRIIKISGDAVFEVLYEHFIKHMKEYTDIEPEGATVDYSIDWQKKSFVFAVKEHGENNISMQKLHSLIPDTTQSIHADKKYEDYLENEVL